MRGASPEIVEGFMSNGYQILVALRHGKTSNKELRQIRFDELTFEGTLVMSHMAAFLCARLNLPLKGMVTSPLPRSKASGRVFLGQASIFHREWVMPDYQPQTSRDLTSWGKSSVGQIQMARDIVKRLVQDGRYSGVVEAAFGDYHCQCALARSGDDGWRVLDQLPNWEQQPGVFLAIGLHSPQIDAMGLRAVGLMQPDSYTDANVRKHLGGYSKQGEGWMIIRNLHSGEHVMRPIKHPPSLVAMLPHLEREQADLERFLAALGGGNK